MKKTILGEILVFIKALVTGGTIDSSTTIKKQNNMIEQLFSDIHNEELAAGAILNEEYHGFREDYLILHCLLRKYNIKSVFEVGTNMGTGTKIIKNAIMPYYNDDDTVVYSLDLPTELAHISLQHPISEGKGDSVGHRCDLPFIQLRGDSMNFDYSPYPAEAYFIDGEHDYMHPKHEAMHAIRNKARLIIFHDADMGPVYNAIIDAFQTVQQHNVFEYKLYRVKDTRIAYAVRA